MRIVTLSFLVVLIFVSGCSSFNLEKGDSLKDFRLNADTYLDETISFKATVVTYGLPDIYMTQDFGVNVVYWKFVDDEGYFVNVISPNRRFELNKFYNVTGKYVKTKANNYYLVE